MGPAVGLARSESTNAATQTCMGSKPDHGNVATRGLQTIALDFLGRSYCSVLSGCTCLNRIISTETKTFRSASALLVIDWKDEEKLEERFRKIVMPYLRMIATRFAFRVSSGSQIKRDAP